MPIYEYGCKNCDHALDALQKLSDPPLVDCPECGQPELKRRISAPRFRLKGEGWYETDFKKDNQRNLAKSDSDTGSKSDSDSGNKTEKTDKSNGKKEGAKTDSAAKPAAGSKADGGAPAAAK